MSCGSIEEANQCYVSIHVFCEGVAARTRGRELAPTLNHQFQFDIFCPHSFANQPLINCKVQLDSWKEVINTKVKCRQE